MRWFESNNSYSHAVNGNSPTSGVVPGQNIVFVQRVFEFILQSGSAVFFSGSRFLTVFGRILVGLHCGWREWMCVCERERESTSPVACAMMNQKEKYYQIGDINHPYRGAKAERWRYKRIFAFFRWKKLWKKIVIPLTCVWLICVYTIIFFLFTRHIYLSFVLSTSHSFYLCRETPHLMEHYLNWAPSKLLRLISIYVMTGDTQQHHDTHTHTKKIFLIYVYGLSFMCSWERSGWPFNMALT